LARARWRRPVTAQAVEQTYSPPFSRKTPIMGMDQGLTIVPFSA
jgi:hypothetical protein